MKENFLTKFTKVNTDILSKYISEGDTVVDATAGNGHDTLSLRRLAGNTGKVYAFDIQKEAIENTKVLLEKTDLSLDNIQLIQDSHSAMDEYIKEKEVQGIIFNLGYLPKGDHNITTVADSTISALKKGLELLKTNGIISILIYHGHEQGKVEKERLQEFGQSLDSKKYHVMMFQLMNQVNDPPCLMLITKK